MLGCTTEKRRALGPLFANGEMNEALDFTASGDLHGQASRAQLPRKDLRRAGAEAAGRAARPGSPSGSEVPARAGHAAPAVGSRAAASPASSDRSAENAPVPERPGLSAVRRAQQADSAGGRKERRLGTTRPAPTAYRGEAPPREPSRPP